MSRNALDQARRKECQLVLFVSFGWYTRLRMDYTITRNVNDVEGRGGGRLYSTTVIFSDIAIPLQSRNERVMQCIIWLAEVVRAKSRENKHYLSKYRNVSIEKRKGRGGGDGGECKLKGNLSSFHCQPSASNRLAFLGSEVSTVCSRV